MAESTAVAERTDTAPHAEAAPSRSRSVVTSGWIPAVLVALAVAVILRYYAVSTGDILLYTGYELLCITLPGTLIWRAVRGRSGVFAVDVAAGTTVGFTVELPVYLLVRQLEIPYAVLAWPIATVVAFAAVPALRRHWRGGDARLPWGVSWSVAVGMLFVVANASMMNFRWSGLSGVAATTPNVDFPFQFALVGVLKHTVPLDTPWLTGTPLLYHWYVYAHGAANSWITGIEPQVLVLRLLPLSMVAAFLILMVALAHRLTGRWWPGVVTLVLVLLGPGTSPFAWTGIPAYNGRIIDNLWISPTQTLAAVLFAAALYVLIDILRATDNRRPGPWIVFTALIGAVAGAKATFIPMVVCGLALALVLRLLTTRRAGPELPALGITLAWMAFAQFVLYGGGSQGTEILPLQTAKWTPVGIAVLGRAMPDNPWALLLVLNLLSLVGMAFAWAGAIGLFKREWRLDPSIHVIAGFAAAGVGGLYVFAHPGLSQSYFARSASPYLALLSAIGLAALVPAGARALRGRLRGGRDEGGNTVRRAQLLTVAAVALGAAALYTTQQTLGEAPPEPEQGGYTLWQAVSPYLLLIALTGLAVAVLVVAGWRLRLGRGVTTAVACVAVLSTAVVNGTWVVESMVTNVTSGTPQRNLTMGPRTVPIGGIEAARWLRDHSSPRDRVATNSHCRITYPKACDSRDFWVAAYSERQVLVQGWSYTEPAFATGGLFDSTLARSVFWDQELLAENDAVFYRPTAASVAAFAERRDVRWLVAVGDRVSPQVAAHATLRHRSGDVSVYELSAG
jgi:hypothetical protein